MVAAQNCRRQQMGDAPVQIVLNKSSPRRLPALFIA
jgi:hypothetical protein